MRATSFFSPAKINLYLAITGRRTDGFHDLVSVVAPLAWGDTLHVEAAAETTLTCDDPAVPVDASNLVLKAAALFREATGWTGGARLALEKRIPMGAGLGGGSSNGAQALKALNRLAGGPLDAAGLAGLAARLGSDCALFLQEGPVAMRGRGERVAALPAGAAARLRGQRLVVMKPAFGIATPWAYGRMVARPETYCPAEHAEARLAEWLGAAERPLADLLYNNMETVAFEKFIALPALLEELRRDFGLAVRMSGSGSACFALLPAGAPEEAIRGAVKAAWGEPALVIFTHLA